MSNRTASSLLADSRLSFLNQQNETALRLAKEAIKNYSFAVKHNPNNGNRYYDLGFVQATNEKLADAIKNLAKADELGCIPENLIQLYNLLGIICFDIGRYDDALINLSNA